MGKWIKLSICTAWINLASISEFLIHGQVGSGCGEWNGDDA